MRRAQGELESLLAQYFARERGPAAESAGAEKQRLRAELMRSLHQLRALRQGVTAEQIPVGGQEASGRPGREPARRADSSGLDGGAGTTATTASVPAGAALQVETGAIAGTVTNNQSSDAIPNVSIQVYDSNGNFVTSGFTDTDGQYTTSGSLPTGTYFVRTSSSAGYVNELYDNFPCTNYCNPTTGTPVSVTAGVTTPDIDFALDVGGRIAGTVTDDETDEPIPSVNIQVYDAGGNFATNVYTDATGQYTTSRGLPTGTYFAQTGNSAGHVDELYDNLPCVGFCTPTTGTPISVTTGATTEGIDFALDPGGRIAGTVTDDETGAPIPNVNIQVYDASGMSVSSGFTDAFGQYVTSAGLPTGTYVVLTSNSEGYINEIYDDLPCVGESCDPRTGTPVSVTLGATTPGIDFALDLGGRIAGTVTDEETGAPLSDVNIGVFDANGDFADFGFTNAFGQFTTGNGLPTGTYFVAAYNGQGYIDEVYENIPCAGCEPTTGTAISVTVGDTISGIDFALERGGTIVGTVTDEETGDPVPDAFLEVYNDSGAVATAGFTDVTGKYTTFSGLPTGAYFVRVVSGPFGVPFSSPGYLGELYDNLPCLASCDPTTGTPVSVTVGAETSGIDFALERGGAIAGTVTDETTADPIPYLDIIEVYDASGVLVARGFTYLTGQYITTALPTGTYFVRTANSRGYIDEIYDNLPCVGLCDPTTGSSVAVTVPITTEGIDFALEFADADRDGVADPSDNCTLVANPEQRDTDEDGYGNYCDADLNGDCETNRDDFLHMRSVFFTGDADADLNGDGGVNFLDLGILKSMFSSPPGPSGVANTCATGSGE